MQNGGESDLFCTIHQRGASFNELDGGGRTPLHCARNAGIAQVLLENGANINAVDFKGETPIHGSAAISYHADVVKLLVEKAPKSM
jgi:ankyrin repeat protein